MYLNFDVKRFKKYFFSYGMSHSILKGLILIIEINDRSQERLEINDRSIGKNAYFKNERLEKCIYHSIVGNMFLPCDEVQTHFETATF